MAGSPFVFFDQETRAQMESPATDLRLYFDN